MSIFLLIYGNIDLRQQGSYESEILRQISDITQEIGMNSSDPAIAFDGFGNAFIVVEPLRFLPTDLEGMGMYVFKSTNGGQSWNNPVAIHPNDKTDDKQWIACDNNPSSAYYGNIYVVGGASSPLRFSSSLDHGNSWKGVGNNSLEKKFTILHMLLKLV